MSTTRKKNLNGMLASAVWPLSLLAVAAVLAPFAHAQESKTHPTKSAEAAASGHGVHVAAAEEAAPARSPRMEGPRVIGRELTKAVAVLQPASGSSVHGTITFTEEAGGVRVMGDVEGLSPGDHGFHVHQYGDLTAADATSAGGHFNPSQEPHGAPTDTERHEGDMGNITAGQDGKAHVDYVDKTLKLNGPMSVIGRAVIVHEKADDLKSQPSGNAGARVAGGVIGVANTEPPKP